MSGRARARALVEDICKGHGYVPQEILDRISKVDRDIVVQAMRTKDELIASSVTTLARNLYSSNARFVFELLQNCDDNHYNKARAHKEAPYVSFSIYSDRIIMECNEDGFTPENLTAICNVGKSSKTGAQGYIGEKGIGFKSVFMAAYKAHIQSGDFSFFFQHRNGDSGMGMITPVWQDPEDELGDHFTRITLLLHDDGDPDVVKKQRQAIRQQFQEIHDTILLFMKNTEKIDIVFYNDDEHEESTIAYSIERQTDPRVAVKKYTCKDGKDQEVVRHYHTTKHVATDLAENENRKYSDLERQSKAYSRGEVVLAFPLDKNSVPEPEKLENQWIFAFLPVRQMGFKFLIQADFVTEANRQDIVTTSARNQGLANGIAEAFIEAVLQFCQHDTLQYQWMRYLPQEDGYPWDSFWSSLIRKIGDRLKCTLVLRPANPGPLRLLAASKKHVGKTLDRHGKPLFTDIIPEIYLSLEYRDQDLDLLEKHGLARITMAEVIARAKSDLAASVSRMKSTDDKDWHSRVARVLHLPFENPWTSSQEAVKQLSLLPLRDGRWTPIKSGAVYYPRVGDTDLDVPVDLILDVVDPKAVANADRKQLFDSIGVQNASVSFVREAVFSKYKGKFELYHRDAAAHLRFLYLTQHLVKPPFHYDEVYLVPQKGFFQKHGLVDFYIRDDDRYGAGELLDRTEPGPNPGDGAPGFDVFFVNNAYFEVMPRPPTEDSLSWKDWLHDFFHVRRHLRLIHKDGTKLSDICQYVSKHRPEKFLGFLQATWELEGSSAAREKDIIKELSVIDVLCVGGKMRRLDSTYLPIKELKQLCSRFLCDGEFFPWLHLEAELSHDTFPREWESLGKVFGLGFNWSDVTFILTVLQSLLDKNLRAESLFNPERVYELYIYLQAEVRKARQPDGCEKLVRKDFVSRKSIFVPESTTQKATWAFPKDCVWESPIEMTTKHSLARLYANHFRKFSADCSNLASFFSKTLEIPNCNWEHVVEEIRAFKSSKCTDFDRISTLYECLKNERLIAISAANLRKTFESEALICDLTSRGTSWHTTAQCLWTSATQIRGMLTLNELYPNLRDFFVKDLGVKKMTAKMVYDKLMGPDLSVEETKQTLETFNSLLLVSKGDEFDPIPILKKKVFPVRFPTNDVRLQTGSDGFALLDRKSLGDDFGDQAKFLDFSVDEIRSLQPLIKWASLEERYLSKAVKEISSVDTDSTRPISSPYREIKLKAHALLSIAVAYSSPRTKSELEAFYTLLRSSETLETDKITSELHLHQDGRTLKVKKAMASLHIREDSTSLQIYVPKNERSQEFCFNSKLPQLFCEWMMTEPMTQIREPVPPEVVNVVQSVLSVKPMALQDVLDYHGISIVATPGEEANELEEEDRGVAGAGPRSSEQSDKELSQARILGNQRIESSGSEDLGTDTPPSSVHSLTTSTASGNEELSYITAASRSAASRPRHPQMNAFLSSSDDYPHLLRKVVNASRRTTLPSRGAFDMSAIHAALLSVTSEEDAVWEPYRMRSTNQLERDKQVGAAGELFVFELLSHLTPSLPGFSRANWQSTIRSYVTSHPEYSNLQPWNGIETADITYADHDSTLTNLLIDKGYLASETWAGARLQYYIEVKTTTRACETPFYMSKRQYKMMQMYTNSNSNSRRTENIYVIFRVFNLGNDSIGLKVLVDPESVRQRGELAFTPVTWSVVARG